MKKFRKIAILVIVATMLFSSITVNAAPAITTKQKIDSMISINEDGVPGWFNASYYSDKYSDLKMVYGNNEKELYEHSLIFGFDESRLVTPVLDVVKYREYYPDLEVAFEDDWDSYVKHYFEYGIDEGRENFTDFNAKTYLNMHEDLQNAFGDDLKLAASHYIEFGYAEGREYNWQVSLTPSYDFYEESDNDDDSDSSSDSDSNDSDVSSDSNGSDSGSSSDSGNDEVLNGDIREDLGDGEGYTIKTYVDGNLTEQTWYDSTGTITGYNYYENGMLVREEEYADGTLSAVIEYRENGKKKSYTVYGENGETISEQIFYDEEGNPITPASESDAT